MRQVAPKAVTTWASLLLGFALLMPSVVDARPQGTAECRHLTTKIDYFGVQLGRAQAVENPVWEERIEDHLDGLVETRAARCEGYSDSDQAWEALSRLVELAAKGAVTFFTMGAM